MKYPYKYNHVVRADERRQLTANKAVCAHMNVPCTYLTTYDIINISHEYRIPTWEVSPMQMAKYIKKHIDGRFYDKK